MLGEPQGLTLSCSLWFRCWWKERRVGLVVGTAFPWRCVLTALAGSTSCLQVHLCHANVYPLPPYLNISVTSPLASATRTGKPMQAGTRYRRAGCKKTQGSEPMLGRAPAQGYAHHSTPFLCMTGTVIAQVHRESQWLGLNLGLLIPRPGLPLPGREGKKPNETKACRALGVPRSLAGSVPVT